MAGTVKVQRQVLGEHFKGSAHGKELRNNTLLTAKEVEPRWHAYHRSRFARVKRLGSSAVHKPQFH